MDKVLPYLPYVAAVLPFVFGIIALAVRGELHGYARKTVAAVYRVAIRAANEMQDGGLAWVRSPEGIAYRQRLAGDAYDALPLTIRGIPVGLVKTVVSREQWCAIVERAFGEVVELAEKLELPQELPE